MTKDIFYRNMTENQLQATFKTILLNIESDPTNKGMYVELELIKNVAIELGFELGNPRKSLQGYMEFLIKKEGEKE